MSTVTSGVAWLTLQSLVGRVIALLSQLALAAILTPADFGLVGLVYAINAVAGAVVNFGLDGVLVQRNRALRLWAAPTFRISLALGVVGFLLALGAAAAGSVIYRSPRILGLATVLALCLPVGALTTVPMALIRSRMEFRFLSIYRTLEYAGTQLLAVALAAAGFGPYSFVLPALVAVTLSVIVFWSRAPTPLRRRFRPVQLRFLLGSGLTISATRLATEAVAQGDYAILGLIATKAEVGVYYFAFRLAAQPLWLIAGNVTSVLMPALTSLDSDADRQLEATVKAARLLAYVVFPACFLQGALADPVLRLLFGAKWTAAIPVMQILSVGLAFDAVTWVTGTLLTARREYLFALKCYGLIVPLFVVLVFSGSALARAPGAAAGVALYYFVMGPTLGSIALRRYGLPVRDALALFARPACTAALAVGGAAAVSWLPGLRDVQAARVAEIGALSLVFYAGLLRIVEPRRLEELLDSLPVQGRAAAAVQAGLRRVLATPAAAL